jgi:hypothetical protein
MKEFSIAICKPDRTKVALIDYSTITVKRSFISPNQIDLTLPKFDKDGKINEYCKYIKQDMLMVVDDYEYYVIAEIEESDSFEMDDQIKIVLYSYE